jgi:sugar phosphate isomerase/epimerase
MRRPTLGSTTVCYPESIGDQFTLERALAGISAAGVEFVELCSIPGYCEHVMPERLNEAGASELREKIARFGLAPRVLNVAGDLTTDQGVQRLVAGLELARRLGAGIVVTHVDEIRDGETRRAFLDRIGRIEAAAAESGVRVGFEVHGGVCSTGPQTVAFVKELGSPWFGVTYDIANVLYAGGVDPVADLEAIGDGFAEHVLHVHLKDKATTKVGEYDFPAFGEGIVDFGAVLAMIERSGYGGLMTIEVELDGRPAAPELVDSSLEASVSYLDRYWDAA